MIIRFVKMTFRAENVEEFKRIFVTEKEKIRSFKGCSKVELLNDIQNPRIFFTRSIWESEELLNEYRNSDFFKKTWAKTKLLFADKPEAWSLKLT